MDERSQLLCLLEGQKGGLTHMKFTPDGTKLVGMISHKKSLITIFGHKHEIRISKKN